MVPVRLLQLAGTHTDVRTLRTYPRRIQPEGHAPPQDLHAHALRPNSRTAVAASNLTMSLLSISIVHATHPPRRAGSSARSFAAPADLGRPRRLVTRAGTSPSASAAIVVIRFTDILLAAVSSVQEFSSTLRLKGGCITQQTPRSCCAHSQGQRHHSGRRGDG